MHHVVAQRFLGVDGERAIRKAAHHVFRSGNVILGQIARIGSRIGERLVLFVKSLRDLQRHLRGKTVALVGFALERREVVKLRRDLARRLFLLENRARFTLALGFDRVGLGLIPDALGPVFLGDFFEGTVEPASAIATGLDAEIREDFPIRPRHEGADFFLPIGEDREGRRLHAARGGFVKAAAL